MRNGQPYRPVKKPGFTNGKRQGVTENPALSHLSLSCPVIKAILMLWQFFVLVSVGGTLEPLHLVSRVFLSAYLVMDINLHYWMQNMIS